LSFVDGQPDAAWQQMRQLWPKARWQRDDAGARKLLRTLFRRTPGPGAPPRWTAFVKGTAFQVNVWRALLRIKPGQLTDYAGLAAAVGAPKAARAVGSAIGRNELAWVIPCHRVIRKSGALGGYRWGLECKKALIAWETGQASISSRTSSATPAPVGPGVAG
jgi:AraC family transcriptional regulator of adaptative response/methylated-DNA-[protein]-cysteine methyltransferase